MQAEIFNGKTLVKVQEGDRVPLYNQFLNPGIDITLSSRANVIVKAVTDELFGTGTFIIITEIIIHDEFEQMKAEASDVEEIEVISNDELPIQIKKNQTKKAIVAEIEANNLEVNTKQTKAKILEELEGLDNVELI